MKPTRIIAADLPGYDAPRRGDRRCRGIAASVKFAREIVVSKRADAIEARDDEQAEVHVALQLCLKGAKIIPRGEAHCPLRAHIAAVNSIGQRRSPCARRLRAEAEGTQPNLVAIH